MTSAQVVETSVTNNSSFQNYPHPDDHTIRTNNNYKSLIYALHVEGDFNRLDDMLWRSEIFLLLES